MIMTNNVALNRNIFCTLNIYSKYDKILLFRIYLRENILLGKKTFYLFKVEKLKSYMQSILYKNNPSYKKIK